MRERERVMKRWMKEGEKRVRREREGGMGVKGRDR